MSQRIASVTRKTSETEVKVRLNLDGKGKCTSRIGLVFLKHMLELTARHARIDLEVEARDNQKIDDHHLTEDLGIVFGRALSQALGEKRGIERYGYALLPMDEVLVAVTLDLGGRSAFACNYSPQREKVGDLSAELVPHFFRTLASEARINLHFHFLNSGENEHHRIEAMFKGFARSLRMAVRIDEELQEEIPSTKGLL